MAALAYRIRVLPCRVTIAFAQIVRTQRRIRLGHIRLEQWRDGGLNRSGWRPVRRHRRLQRARLGIGLRVKATLPVTGCATIPVRGDLRGARLHSSDQLVRHCARARRLRFRPRIVLRHGGRRLRRCPDNGRNTESSVPGRRRSNISTPISATRRAARPPAALTRA